MRTQQAFGGQDVTLSATIGDPFDGTIRILGDAQRFGLNLKGLRLGPDELGTTRVTIELDVPCDYDLDLLMSRFARHGAVLNVSGAGGQG